MDKYSVLVAVLVNHDSVLVDICKSIIMILSSLRLDKYAFLHNYPCLHIRLAWCLDISGSGDPTKGLHVCENAYAHANVYALPVCMRMFMRMFMLPTRIYVHVHSHVYVHPHIRVDVYCAISCLFESVHVRVYIRISCSPLQCTCACVYVCACNMSLCA